MILLQTVVIESTMSDFISVVLLMVGTSGILSDLPIGPLVTLISYLLAQNPMFALFYDKIIKKI